MITLGPEPEGLLLRAADVRAWVPGLTRHQWLRLRRGLRVVQIDGKPFYRREEVRAKIVARVAGSTFTEDAGHVLPAQTKDHR